MVQQSAGILLYRGTGDSVEVLLAHPGGPFWAKKDDGAWSIPKGELTEGEDALDAARREFEEEMGSPPSGEAIALGSLKQPSAKLVHAFAVRGDFDVAGLRSNSFEMEWPPRSGRRQEFPEVDRAAWFALAEARKKILPGQAAFLDRLRDALAARG